MKAKVDSCVRGWLKSNSFLFLKIVLMEHFLAMVYAMMKQTMLNATLMAEIVVEPVSTQSIVHNVFVIMKQNQYLIFHVRSFLLRKC